MRDVTAKIRAIELFNPDGLHPFSSIYFVSHPRSLASRLSVLRSYLLRRPRILCPACCLCPSFFFDTTFSVATYFFCLASRPCSLCSISFILCHHPHPLSPARPLAWPARSFVTAPLFSLSHSICHPPSFHHPSKPWSLTGDTYTHTYIHTYTRARARALFCSSRLIFGIGSKRCGKTTSATASYSFENTRNKIYELLRQLIETEFDPDAPLFHVLSLTSKRSRVLAYCDRTCLLAPSRLIAVR